MLRLMPSLYAIVYVHLFDYAMSSTTLLFAYARHQFSLLFTMLSMPCLIIADAAL